MIRYQDNFYNAINGEWIENASIPDDKSRTGGFYDLSDAIEELMLETTDQWLKDENLPENSILKEFIKYHKMVSDFETRDDLGVGPILPLIEEYHQLTSFSEFAKRMAEHEICLLYTSPSPRD